MFWSVFPLLSGNTDQVLNVDPIRSTGPVPSSSTAAPGESCHPAPTPPPPVDSATDAAGEASAVPDNTPVDPVATATFNPDPVAAVSNITDLIAAAGDVGDATNLANPVANRATGNRPAATDSGNHGPQIRHKTTVSRPLPGLRLEKEPETQDDGPKPRAAKPQGGFFFVRSAR